MQDGRKAVWSIQYISVAFFSSLKQNFIVNRSSKVSSRPDCIFEIQQQWKSGFSRMCSSSCCSCWFEPEIIRISQSSHQMYSNNIVNFQDSTTILNACPETSEIFLNAPRIYIYIYIYIYMCVCVCVCVCVCDIYIYMCVCDIYIFIYMCVCDIYI